MNKRATLLFLFWILTVPGAALSNQLGLTNAYESSTRGHFDLHSGQYEPVYEVEISDAKPGEVLRLAGRVEASEKNCEISRFWSYLTVEHPNGIVTRVSPYAWQWVTRKTNHHMPLNLYGALTVSQAGPYKFRLEARATSTKPVDLLGNCDGGPDPDWQRLQDQGIATSNMRLEYIPKPEPEGLSGPVTNLDEYDSYDSEFGGLIVERFTPLSEANSPGLLRGIVDFDRKTIFPTGQVQNNIELVSETKPFYTKSSDIVRFQGMATAQFQGGNNIFRLESNYGGPRLAVSTENIVQDLYRFSLVNDAVQTSPGNTPSKFSQRISGVTDDPDAYTIPANQQDLAAIHFSDTGPAKFLKSSDYVHVGSNIPIPNGAGVPIEVARFEGTAEASDIIRVQSQVQIDLTSGSLGSCSAKIEIWEDAGSGFLRKYVSTPDQRYLRTGHVSGSYTPFALHEVSGANVDYRVDLIARCSSSDSAFSAFLTNYGQGLLIDHFSN